MARTTDPDEMDMPCACDICGDCFDLHDGNPSSDRTDNTIYCPNCVKEPWGDKPDDYR